MLLLLPRLGAGAALAGLLLIGSASAQTPPPGDLVEPGAGRWRTWVLTSGDQFRLPAPPNEAATRAELGQLRAMMAEADQRTRERIVWWSQAAPSYRWNQIAIDEAIRAGLSANVASRRLAVLHTALADAMVATWDSKFAHNRARPGALDPTLRTVVAAPHSPSYPDEHAVAAAVASTVLAAMFPERAAAFTELAGEASRMRLLAGVAFPSDVAAGTDLGRRIAQVALERAARDRSDQPWTGSIPTAPGHWNGTNPILPQAATWLPWMLASPDEFRPPAPPAHDSAERAAQMTLVREYPRTPATNARALFWEVAVGGLRNYQYWNAHLSRLMLESGQAVSPPRAARNYALFQASIHDAGVACWDAKYAYWAIRPFQLDRQFQPVFPTPNHPSYPAAHACYSMTAAVVLAHLYPNDAQAMLALARESGDSRVWAGIHYPMDVAAGQTLAERVAGRAIERARADGADPAN